MTEFHVVPREMIGDLWPAIEPMLAKVIPHHPFMTTAGIFENIQAGHTAAVIAVRSGKVVAACVLEQISFPRGATVGNIYMLGAPVGFYRHMPALLEFLETWARDKGCDYLSFTGRRAWRKLCEKLGWRWQDCVHGWRQLRAVT